MLNATMNIKGSELVVKLEGRLDALTSQKFEKDLEGAMKGITDLTVDCADLEYISSAGLRTLLAAQQYMEERDYEDVKVINCNESVLDIFEETGFNDVLNIVK